MKSPKKSGFFLCWSRVQQVFAGNPREPPKIAPDFTTKDWVIRVLPSSSGSAHGSWVQAPEFRWKNAPLSHRRRSSSPTERSMEDRPPISLSPDLSRHLTLSAKSLSRHLTLSLSNLSLSLNLSLTVSVSLYLTVSR
jgi:hypothetical protein